MVQVYVTVGWDLPRVSQCEKMIGTMVYLGAPEATTAGVYCVG